ncbi:DUF2156 domain-containing protein [Paraburkholderia saeva]|uniref:Phosphatidylglycerol lysyltransferase C-terminal domain-containing protein n=1 Tax=Paraburkholderia saeva TaxID=2777537 RepID=A0A9N8RYW9_9BURK|nr:DUF2156 domain-containing protein [Paraburkholderia saeva]CAG4903121.1 hypothetical protein R70241_03046 [Paraburkholderia saeva]CAG4908732.1 hypothetical protein LMG31841_03792 [Paraburkholderia saeva]CAG4910355.1 hypothetical protein R52603_03817 [Paraburkholderia saeva]
MQLDAPVNVLAGRIADASGDAVGVLRRHADHPSALLAINQDTLRFHDPAIDGLIAYRPAGRHHLVMAAGITAAPDQRALLLDRFLGWARRERRKVVAVQMFRDDAVLFASRGFRVNQIGASYSVSLDRFRISGTPFIKLRNKISRARRSNVSVLELGVDLPATSHIGEAIAAIDREWIKDKGAKELAFLIGEVGAPDQLDRSVKRLFVAMQNGETVAYVLYTASFGRHSGWMHDLTRRRPDTATGVMELINITAIERFKAEGAGMLNFGFTPLTSLADEHEIADACSRATAWTFRKLARHGSFIYPAEAQLQYKLKWAPDLVQPEYIAFQNGTAVSSLWQFLRLTRAI